MDRTQLGMFLGLVGICLILIRNWATSRLARIYRRFGFEVPEASYAKQFVVIGILLATLGFLMATGLIDAL